MYLPGPYALDWNLERGRDDGDGPYIVPTLPEPFDVVDFELEKKGTMEVLGWSDIRCPHPRRTGLEGAGPVAWVRAGLAGGMGLVHEACSTFKHYARKAWENVARFPAVAGALGGAAATMLVGGLFVEEGVAARVPAVGCIVNGTTAVALLCGAVAVGLDQCEKCEAMRKASEDATRAREGKRVCRP